MILTPTDCKVHEPESWGPLLGVIDWADWPVTKLRLEPGDSMVLFTDGLIEARAGAELFGTDRICEILEKDRTSAIEQRVENLVAAARPGGWGLARVTGLFPRLGERSGQRAATLSGS